MKAPLTWLVDAAGGLRAETSFGAYRALTLSSDYTSLLFNGKPIETEHESGFETMCLAKAAAQADYDQRIRSAPAPNTLPPATAEAQGVKEAWEELCGMDDRTSPEEYPDMCLITKEELASFMAAASFPPIGQALVPLKMTAGMINAWSGGITVSTDEIAYRTHFQDAWARVLAATLPHTQEAGTK